MLALNRSLGYEPAHGRYMHREDARAAGGPGSRAILLLHVWSANDADGPWSELPAHARVTSGP